MPETLIKVDLSKSAYDNDMIHNRWHPDIPMVSWVNPGDDFIIETYDWTGGFIKNNDSADDVRDIDLSIVHFLSRPDRRQGRRARRSPGGRPARRRSVEGEPLGLQRLLLQTKWRRLPDRSFPAGAEIDLGHQGPLHVVASHSRRELRRSDPSRPDRLSARSEIAGHLERTRECADRDQSDPRTGPCQSTLRGDRSRRPCQGRRQGQGRRGRCPHRAAARAWRQLRHQGPVARLEDLLPGLCAGRRSLDGRSALQPGRRRNHLLRCDRNGRLAAPEGRYHQGRGGQSTASRIPCSSRRRSRRTTRTI